MPDCLNCGSHVSEAYVRVFAPNGYEQPRVCPYCEDKVRRGSTVRESRSASTGRERGRTKYSPAKARAQGGSDADA